MKQFVNNIEKSCLSKAVIEWILGIDGYDGAIGGVLCEIPWSEEMGFCFWKKDVYDKIDNAIGNRYDIIDGVKHGWEFSRLINFNDNTEDTIAYRQKFQKFIDDKVEHIYNAYQECIDELNGSL